MTVAVKLFSSGRHYYLPDYHSGRRGRQVLEGTAGVGSKEGEMAQGRGSLISSGVRSCVRSGKKELLLVSTFDYVYARVDWFGNE